MFVVELDATANNNKWLRNISMWASLLLFFTSPSADEQSLPKDWKQVTVDFWNRRRSMLKERVTLGTQESIPRKAVMGWFSFEARGTYKKNHRKKWNGWRITLYVYLHCNIHNTSRAMGKNKKDQRVKRRKKISNQIFLWESSTATLNAPNNAVSCIFSEPPNDSRCLCFFFRASAYTLSNHLPVFRSIGYDIYIYIYIFFFFKRLTLYFPDDPAGISYFVLAIRPYLRIRMRLQSNLAAQDLFRF